MFDLDSFKNGPEMPVVNLGDTTLPAHHTKRRDGHLANDFGYIHRNVSLDFPVEPNGRLPRLGRLSLHWAGGHCWKGGKL